MKQPWPRISSPHFRVLFHLLIALAMLPGLFRLKGDNSPRVFFVRDGNSLNTFARFQETFAGGRALRISLWGEHLWTQDNLHWLGELEQRLTRLPGVSGVAGLSALYQWIWQEWPPSDPSAFRNRLLSDSLERRAGWISENGRIISIQIILEDLPAHQMVHLLLRLENILNAPPHGIDITLSGLPVLERAMDRSLFRSVALILPMLILLSALLLRVLLGRMRDTLSPLIFAAMVELSLFGLMGYCNIGLNLVNAVLAILIFVISMATAIHILLRFRSLHHQGMDQITALKATYRSKKQPVLWTGASTFVAFFSLVSGNIPPIRTIGMWAGLGILLMTLMLFSFYPSLLRLLYKRSSQSSDSAYETWSAVFSMSLARWAARHRKAVLLTGGLLFLLALSGLNRLRIEDSLVRYFPKDNPIRLVQEQLDREGLGSYPAEFLLDMDTTGSETQGFQNPLALEKLAGLSASLRRLEPVRGALSAGDLLDAALETLLIEGKGNSTSRWLALGMLQTAPESRKLLRSLLSPDGMQTRISILLPMMSVYEAESLFDRIKTEGSHFFPGSQGEITGQFPLILMAQGNLIRGLAVSLSITLLCVAGAFFFLLRHPGLSLRVLLPNLWPIVMTAGGMAWLGVPFDSVSIMSGAVVLGLAVDDTIHSACHYIRLEPRCGATAAIASTLFRTAPAQILTSLILVTGFASFSLSGFLPVIRMGLISATAILLALLGDLLLIPALLSQKNGTAKQKPVSWIKGEQVRP